MRLKLYLDLENENLPIQYRKNVISFIKLSLSEYDEDYYKRFYNQKDNIIKPYTFSVFFKKPEFKEEIIIIKNKQLELNISIASSFRFGTGCAYLWVVVSFECPRSS